MKDVEEQSIFSLIANGKKSMLALAASHGFRPLPGSLAPVLKGGERPDHGKNPAVYFAEMALLLMWRFGEAWRAKKYERAAEYAYLAGEYRGKAYMHGRKALQSLKGKQSTSREAQKRSADLVARAIVKCREKRGLCSIKDLHRWLSVQISLPRFYALMHEADFSEQRRKIREEFIAKR